MHSNFLFTIRYFALFSIFAFFIYFVNDINTYLGHQLYRIRTGNETQENVTLIPELILFSESMGRLAPLTLLICHCIGIIGSLKHFKITTIVCFPGTIFFEIAAGFLFGFLGGVVLVSFAKGIGGIIGFILGKTLLKNYLNTKFAGDQRFKLISEKISKEGFKFAILLRLSPLPSWINTYGLSLTNIQFPSYALATLVGSLPFILHNVYLGTIVQGLGNLANATQGDQTSVKYRTILMSVGAVSSLLLVRQVIRYISEASLEVVKADGKNKD